MPKDHTDANKPGPAKKDLPPIVREVPDPPVPNRAHTEMKKSGGCEERVE